MQQVPTLRLFQPLPCPDAALLRAVDFADAGGALCSPLFGRLGRELTDGGESDVVGRRRERLRFEMTPVSCTTALENGGRTTRPIPSEQ